MKTIVWALAFAVGACSPTTYTQSIPNLYQVHSGLWRSGQPTSNEQWQYLYNLGIRHVVKLNFDTEGKDDGATRTGMVVHVLSIQPAGDRDLWDDIRGSFVQPERARIDEAESIINAGGGVLVHCTHGQDRTGLVVGISRVRLEHWSKNAAWSEMVEKGFHPALLGLTSFWVDDVGGT